MVVGEYVKRKDEEVYGVVTDTLLGLGIIFWESDNENKTLGVTLFALEKYWNVIDGLPEGYEIDQYGLPAKMIK